jgi:hypothetical protein
MNPPEASSVRPGFRGRVATGLFIRNGLRSIAARSAYDDRRPSQAHQVGARHPGCERASHGRHSPTAAHASATRKKHLVPWALSESCAHLVGVAPHVGSVQVQKPRTHAHDPSDARPASHVMTSSVLGHRSPSGAHAVSFTTSIGAGHEVAGPLLPLLLEGLQALANASITATKTKALPRSPFRDRIIPYNEAVLLGLCCHVIGRRRSESGQGDSGALGCP